jgi:hypothetical protein
MKKIIIANHTLLSSGRPWQREDENYFEAALKRFACVCDMANKHKARLVLTGQMLGRITTTQLMQVIQLLPKHTAIVTEKPTPLLFEMAKANFIELVTPGNVLNDDISIGLLRADQTEEVDFEKSECKKVIFAQSVENVKNFDAIFVLQSDSVSKKHELGLPNAIRLFPGDEHKPSVKLLKVDASNQLLMETIYTSFDDTHYLAPITAKSEQTEGNLALSENGSASGFATLLKEHGEKLASGNMADVTDMVTDTRSDDEDLETYINKLHQDATAAIAIKP